MGVSTSTALPGAKREPTLPPLENGDRLTQAEFERRYNAMPHLKKAELIEGVVYVPSPVRHRQLGSSSPTASTTAGATKGATWSPCRSSCRS